MNTFKKLLKLSNKHTVGIHLLNNGFFLLYLPEGSKKYKHNQKGMEQAINDMENLK